MSKSKFIFPFLVLLILSSSKMYVSIAYAWVVSKSAQSVCVLDNNTNSANIKVSFTSNEANGMNVVAKDNGTGQSVDLGTVSSGETKTGEIKTNQQNISDNSVTFTMTWIDGSESQTVTSNYSAIACNQPTPTVTPTETVMPAPTQPPSNPPSNPPPAGPPPVCVPSIITTVPIIIESKRIDSNNVFISWGPYAGLNDFIVEYGFQEGNLTFNTKVNGFSTTIGSLPANQPIFVRVAATDNCAIGAFGPTVKAGITTSVPALPKTGFEPKQISWRIIVSGFLSLTPFAFSIIKRRKTILPKS